MQCPKPRLVGMIPRQKMAESHPLTPALSQREREIGRDAPGRACMKVREIAVGDGGA